MLCILNLGLSVGGALTVSFSTSVSAACISICIIRIITQTITFQLGTGI